MSVRIPIRWVAASVALWLGTGLYGQTSASAALRHAEAMHEALQREPASQRSSSEYRRIAGMMAEVWKKDDSTQIGQQAEYEAGSVYVGLALDQHDRSAWKSAADCFATLLKVRPYSAYRRNAEWALAQIELNHLGQSSAAKHWLKDFTRRYPADPRVEIAHQQMRGVRVASAPILGQRAIGPSPLPLAASETARDSDHSRTRRSEASAEHASPVRASHHSSARERVAHAAAPSAKTEAPVALPLGRLHEIVFGRVGDASANGLNQILGLRVLSGTDETTIIVDLSRPVHVLHAALPETHRFYFDLHDSEMGSLVTSSGIQKLSVNDGRVLDVHIGQNRKGVIRLVIDAASAQVNADDGSLLTGPPRFEIHVSTGHGAAPVHHAAPAAPLPGTSLARTSAPAPHAVEAHTTVARSDKPESRTPDKSTTETAEARRPAMAPAPPPEHAASAASHDTVPAASHETASASPGPLYTAKGDPPTREGSRSLTRVLGLKIHKIVLDAGHGGHDTGTIGPGNLYEKDVVLDVTRRLGRLLKDRLDMDVIYTRKTDVFIPLQERTAIANRANADLFLSIHANSSDDHSVRGIETYYLDFTKNPRALAVAARENATGELSSHSLQTLIQRIALNDKQQESREFAGDLLNYLVRTTKVEDRGVKSAPFVVLIGARMPSVLAEISFLSDSTDAHLLRTSSYREKIAEALYKGVKQYLESLNGVQALAARQDDEAHAPRSTSGAKLRTVSDRTH